MRTLLAILLFSGCNPENRFPGGTGVGNPGTTQLQTRQDGDPTLLTGEGTLVAFEVDRCGAEEDVTESVGETVDLLGAGPFPAPGGPWCSIDVVFDGPLLYTGIEEPGDTDSTLEVILEVAVVTIPVSTGLRVDGDTLVVELGHREWLDEDVIGELDDRHTVVDASHPAYDIVVSSVRDGSALFVDTNSDGALDATERAAPAGAGPLWAEAEEHDE